jgi:hypothetical protein
MRRLHLGVLTAMLPMLALSLTLAGCRAKKDEDEEVAPRSSKGKAAAKDKGRAKGPQFKPVEAKEYGVVRGKIKWAGDKLNFDDLDKAMQELVKKTPTDKDHCLLGNQHQHEYRIGANGNVGNVFVWLKAPAGSYFKVPQAQLEKIKNVELGQPKCNFTPHCLVLFPSYQDGAALKPTGQKLVVKNDDTVTHNTKVEGGPRNPQKGSTLPVGKSEEMTLVPDDQVLTISCNIHPYMRGYARVFAHPYATVSKAPEKDDDPAFGTFEITGVPVGAKVNVIAWHEKAGYGLRGPEGQSVELKKENDVEFEMKMP